jgi:hypothetical protein
MIYKRTAVQKCEKQNQSIGGSCAEKIKLFYFCPIDPSPPPPWPTQDLNQDEENLMTQYVNNTFNKFKDLLNL